jgi:arginyl-tRNA synthetase
LAKQYGHFYQTQAILIEVDLDKKLGRLTLSANVAKVLKSGLSMLGISAPKKM